MSAAAPGIFDALLGAEWRGRQLPCPIHDDTGTSFDVDERRAVWTCRGGCGGGDASALARRMLGDDAARDLLRELGTTDGDEQKQTDAAIRARNARTLRETVADDGTIAAYLRHRGLAGDVPAALRLHRALPYFDDVGERLADFAAIIAEVTTLAGETVALHRTYLAAGGAGKADVPTPRKLTSAIREGATRGAAIHLAEPIDGLLALTEGIETGLAVMQASGTPTWACVSAGGLAAVEVPESVRELDVWADREASNVGLAAAHDAAKRLHTAGRSVRILIPQRAGDDWLDVLVRDGAEVLRQAHATARVALDQADGDAASTAHEVVAQLLAAVSDDRGAALEAPALGALAHIRTHDAAAWVRVREWLRAARVPMGELDAAMARRCGGTDDGEAADAGLLRSWTVAPWPELVATADLLDELVTTYRRYIVLPAHGAEAIALWILHAWAHDAATVSPLLVYVSPEKRCGKTTGLLLLRYTAPRPLSAANVTAAVLFRAVERWRPTLLLDEADTFLEEADELRGIINSGHVRAMAQTIRCVGDDHEPRTYSTWSPKALALIQHGRGLHDTLRDRSIILEMRRRLASEHVERLRGDQDAAHLDLRRRAARWAADALEALRAADPALPRGLDDRAGDNWRPLLAIADLAGGGWPDRARQAALALSGEVTADTDSVRTLLLGDVADHLEEAGGRLASTMLAERLAGMEERPWPEWHRGRPITPRQVASLLRPLGVVPRSIRLADGATPKGYLADDTALRDALSRYLPPRRSATPPQPAPDAAGSDTTIRHTGELWRIENPRKPALDAACGAVADGDGGYYQGERELWEL